MSILSLFHIEVHPEQEQAFVADFMATLPIALKQKGLKSASAYTPVGEKQKYLLITEWDNEESIRAWMEVPDHKKVIAKAGQYVKDYRIKRYSPK
ncbi:MAG: antibiotic biosynthesis monooxygenase family protein [Candidatus Brocadiales bacterium]